MINQNQENKLFKFLLIIAFVTNNKENNYLHNKRIYNLQIPVINSSTLKIFIMAHKDFYNIRYNPIYNIVVDDKSQLKNKYNLNIIYANDGKLYNMKRAYGEMSKLYYIYQLYKNGTITSKYIGLNHYRRYFKFGDNIPLLDDIFSKYEVILNKQVYIKRNIKSQYCKEHICKNFYEIMNIIKRFKPEYFNTSIKVCKMRKEYFNNIFIMRKEDFFKYCEFVFDILFEFDKNNNFKSDLDVLNYTKKIYSNSNDYYLQSRMQGYLAERISNIFFNHYFKKIKTFDVEFIN